MATTLTIDPVTRIEGHLKIDVTVETVNNTQQVIDARSSGTMFRGLEIILKDKNPNDATHFTQRICGVCPVSHGVASALTLESALAAAIPENGRILRNLILGANFIQSHVLHFYHLAALDYIDTTGLLDLAPWMPRYTAPDMATGEAALRLVNSYVEALSIRRKAHKMAALFSGKMPCSPALVAGGCTETPTAEKINAFRMLLDEIRLFIDNTMLPDLQLVASAFPMYSRVGRGCGNLLAYGVFDLDAGGTSKLLARGTFTDNTLMNTIDVDQIKEYVGYSKFSSPSGLNPAIGETTPAAYKTDAYSWIKAPRYNNKVHELGPLARMWINGDYRQGISVLDRLAARVLETKKIADAMNLWLSQLLPGQGAYAFTAIPFSATGTGLTEAPRGALGHWIEIGQQKISRYQVIAPTSWNASPMDDMGQKGPIEQALIGTPVSDINQPAEVLRVIHSFDPCLACSVHMLRPGKDKGTVVKTIDPAV